MANCLDELNEIMRSIRLTYSGVSADTSVSAVLLPYAVTHNNVRTKPIDSLDMEGANEGKLNK